MSSVWLHVDAAFRVTPVWGGLPFSFLGNSYFSPWLFPGLHVTALTKGYPSGSSQLQRKGQGRGVPPGDKQRSTF